MCGGVTAINHFTLSEKWKRKKNIVSEILENVKKNGGETFAEKIFVIKNSIRCFHSLRSFRKQQTDISTTNASKLPTKY